MGGNHKQFYRAQTGAWCTCTHTSTCIHTVMFMQTSLNMQPNIRIEIALLDDQWKYLPKFDWNSEITFYQFLKSKSYPGHTEEIMQPQHITWSEDYLGIPPKRFAIKHPGKRPWIIKTDDWSIPVYRHDTHPSCASQTLGWRVRWTMWHTPPHPPLQVANQAVLFIIHTKTWIFHKADCQAAIPHECLCTSVVAFQFFLRSS